MINRVHGYVSKYEWVSSKSGVFEEKEKKKLHLIGLFRTITTGQKTFCEKMNINEWF